MQITGYIYKFTSPSGKSYIGQTYQDPNKRKEQHRYSAEKGNIKTKFYDAIHKYGFDSFDFSILKTIIEDQKNIKSELDQLETYYIGKYDSYQNGYNMTIGGDTSGKTCGKQVSSYDKNGNYIATFESTHEAARVLGHSESSSTISQCARNEYGTALGFQWRFGDCMENIGELIYNSKSKQKSRLGKDNPRSKKVYQYSKSGELIYVWNSALEAEREEGFSSTEISNAATGKKEHYGKRGQQRYIWSFKELTKEQIIEKVNNMTSKYKYTHEEKN